ncbi:EAL domain-containing protein [Acidovorax sp. Leaf160]|uniref:bifunctional diguanylate cyclase/phosphodiesterase n=1 Tax=Acidovorax sp. Leaf160 TaxID=1736280 RepID=UPI0009EA0381|nr:EAL domain-containing protein [Acidovorax sp. Leaf160]
MPRRWQPSLRAAIAVPLALLFGVTVALLALSQHRQINDLIDQEGARLLSAITASSQIRLAAYLETPYQVQRTLADTISRQRLQRPGDASAVAAYLRSVFPGRYSEFAQIGLLGFGGRDDAYAAVRRDDAFRLILQDRSTGGLMHIHEGLETTTAVTSALAGFQPSQRPWYTAALHAGKTAWSPIYTSASRQGDVIISAATPVVVDGETVGVVGADVRLDSLQRFLHAEPLRGHGSLFIAEADGTLVAQSHPSPIVGERGGSSQLSPRTRLHAHQSADPLVRAAATHLDPVGAEGHSFRLVQGNALYFGRVSAFTAGPGLDWRIVVLLPEADLLGDARERLGHWTLAAVLGALIALLAALWAVQRVSRPILQTAQAADRLAQGDWSTASELLARPHEGLRETAVLSRAFQRMAAQLRHSFEQLQDQLRTDPLTGVLTRRGLLERADWPDERAAALTLVGLDAFRSVNHGVGFATANQLLHAVAARLSARLPEPLLIARVSGDEFAILHLGVDGLSQQAIGKAVQKLFATPFSAGEDELLLSASVGVVGGTLRGADLPEWLRQASVALGEAKQAGRDQCVVFDAPMMELSLQRGRLVTELRQALDRQQLVLHYQPLIDLASGRVTGAEALVRWNHPLRGLVSPAAFIPAAEESGLILPLGEWVLRTATQAVAERLGSLPPDFNLHVNVSVRQLIQSDFTTRVRQALRTSGLPPGQLTLELTESQRISDGDSGTRARLTALRALGVKIAIDDFGTGYSSLTYLTDLPFDSLKMDQRFVRSLLQTPRDAAIVESVLSLARGLGVTVVAEGVETQAQASRLRALQCDAAQGFCFGHPVPLPELDLSVRTIGLADEGAPSAEDPAPRTAATAPAAAPNDGQA